MSAVIMCRPWPGDHVIEVSGADWLWGLLNKVGLWGCISCPLMGGGTLAIWWYM
jgi:hypothetical protein